MRRILEWLDNLITRTPEPIALLGIFVLVALIMIAFNATYIPALKLLKKWLPEHPRLIALVLTAVAVMFGALAAHWKQREQRSYGFMEIVFGTLFSFNIILKLAPNFDFAKLFAIGSAMYVIARGFNNFFEARKLVTSAAPHQVDVVTPPHGLGVG